jgi:hypothetical protein
MKKQEVKALKSRVIHKKVWPEYFHQAKSWRKNFEVRMGDMEVEDGDTLVLHEWEPGEKRYTGRTLVRKVTYVMHLLPGSKIFDPEKFKKHGMKIIGIKGVER